MQELICAYLYLVSRDLEVGCFVGIKRTIWRVGVGRANFSVGLSQFSWIFYNVDCCKESHPRGSISTTAKSLIFRAFSMPLSNIFDCYEL